MNSRKVNSSLSGKNEVKRPQQQRDLKSRKKPREEENDDKTKNNEVRSHHHEQMCSSSSRKKKRCDKSSLSSQFDSYMLRLILWNGSLQWHEAVSTLSLVSKEWKSVVESEKHRLADWEGIVKYLDGLNGFNRCGKCRKRNIVECRCWDMFQKRRRRRPGDGDCSSSCSSSSSESSCSDQSVSSSSFSEEGLERPYREDPRNSTSAPFHCLPPYIQARDLFRFHSKCISSFHIRFCGNGMGGSIGSSFGGGSSSFSSLSSSSPSTNFDLSQRENYAAQSHVQLLNLTDFEDLFETNNNAFNLLFNIAEIIIASDVLSSNGIAQSFLRCYFQEESSGYEASSNEEEFSRHDGRVLERVGQILNISTKPAHRHDGNNQDQEGTPQRRIRVVTPQFQFEYTPSHMQLLGNSIRTVLLRRCQRADSLLGRDLADCINAMTKVRLAMMEEDSIGCGVGSRMSDIFPLNWMPLFGGDRESYVPPSEEVYSKNSTHSSETHLTYKKSDVC